MNQEKGEAGLAGRSINRRRTETEEEKKGAREKGEEVGHKGPATQLHSKHGETSKERYAKREKHESPAAKDNRVNLG